MAQEGAESDGRIKLARIPSFRMGELEVHPSTRQLIRGGRSQTLEPRVMQVLVALAEGKGAVITRDELIQRCWEGRVVSEAAINRVISRIRQIAADLGENAFQLETIAKVGYRMIVAGAGPARVPPASLPSEEVDRHLTVHRRLILGGGAVIVLLGGAIGFRDAFMPDYTPSEEAKALYRKGVELQGQGIAAQIEQAAAYFLEATRVDPAYADAWGALALAYRHLAGWHQGAEADSFSKRSRSAAARALELDGENADAQLATILSRPSYGNWADFEAGCRRILSRHQTHVQAWAALANLMCDVGRWRDAIPMFEDVNAQNPFLPVMRYRYIIALWSAGRLQDAERELDRAMARWPRHSAIWETRFKFLAHTGRPAAALAFATDVSGRPLDHHSEAEFEPNLATARALQSRNMADTRSAVALSLQRTQQEPGHVHTAVQNCAALGQVDAAFSLLRGLYLAAGPWAAAASLSPNRPTSILFNPLTASLRRDRRFILLTNAIGLEDYWRATKTLPDYRRTL